jgi:hypothetical protein
LLSGEGLAGLCERWRSCLLIREQEGDAGKFVLTGNGSWHLSAMLEELEALRI